MRLLQLLICNGGSPPCSHRQSTLRGFQVLRCTDRLHQLIFGVLFVGCTTTPSLQPHPHCNQGLKVPKLEPQHRIKVSRLACRHYYIVLPANCHFLLQRRCDLQWSTESRSARLLWHCIAQCRQGLQHINAIHKSYWPSRQHMPCLRSTVSLVVCCAACLHPALST